MKICQRLDEGRVHERTRVRVNELEFHWAGVALIRDGHEGVKNTFKGCGRACPTAGESLAIYRQFAEQAADTTGVGVVPGGCDVFMVRSSP